MIWLLAYASCVLGWVSRSYYEEWRTKRAEASVWREQADLVAEMDERRKNIAKALLNLHVPQIDDMQLTRDIYRQALPPKREHKIRRIK